jgi:hypothetical protein
VLCAARVERRVEESGDDGRATVPYSATVPRVLFTSARGRGPAARAMRGARNAGRGALPTVGKREGFFF